MAVGVSKISMGEGTMSIANVRRKTILERHASSGVANTILINSTPTGKSRRLLFVGVTYSASATENVTVVLNSGFGGPGDIIVDTIVIAAGTEGFFLPAVPIYLSDDDTLDVTAPAGGAGITATITIVTELL